jgi:DNA-binding CsgD family transcriptional regulator
MTVVAKTKMEAAGAPVLLERSAELGVLAEALESVAAGGVGRLALVRGEAGAGKTALVRRFCECRDGAGVFWGVCDPLFAPRPLGPLLDVAAAAGVGVAEAQPYEVARIVLGLLEAVPPALLVVEDVHWADEATLDALRILVRRIESVPALVVLTYRDGEVDRRHPLRGLLGELSFARRAASVGVEPLSLAAVAALAEPYGVDADDLYRKTGGNAFFVTEVRAAGGDAVPETLRDAVLARASRLSAAARALLETVAMLPPLAETWLLDRVAPGPAERMVECLASGMLREEAGGVVFRHELARAAVEESLPRPERLVVHRRALAALAERQGGPLQVGLLAHHAYAAGDVDAVLRFAPAAGAQAASVGAHREAADLYARALRYRDRLAPTDQAELLVRRGTECYLTDDNSEAIESLQGALVCQRAIGDTRAEGATLVVLSEFVWCPGRVAESNRAGREALALLEPLGLSPELVGAYGNLARLAVYASDREEALGWATREFAAAEALGDVEASAEALAHLGQAEALAGEEDGVRKLEQALEIAQRHGFDDATGWIKLELAHSLLGLRSYVEADRRLAHALAYCSERGLELYRQYSLAYSARSALDQGRWAQAAEFAELVLRVRRASTTPSIVCLVVAALLRARGGDLDPSSLLDEADELAEMSGELPRLGPVAAARAEAAWLEGRHDAVIPLTAAAFDLALARRDPWTAGELALWRRRAGAVEEAPAVASSPYALQLAGDFEQAAETWRRIGCPYESALALADADDESALRRALEQLHRLGAAPAAAHVARRLRERGARGIPRGPRPATRANPANLTDRELDVLGLLCQGLRNAEIAARLFLSVKTVDTHVAAILRKLGVRGRAQATAAALRDGLVTQDR